MGERGALERRAEEWIADYSQAEHLVRTRDWVVEIEPQAGEALRLAALTHDIERFFPGGPIQDRGGAEWDDPAYIAAHCERSAEIATAWLREQGADESLIVEVAELVRHHEHGGFPDADLLQAADSISFLETLSEIAAGWVRDGICSADKARVKHDWMYQRIRVERARELAHPHYEAALAAVDWEAESQARRLAAATGEAGDSEAGRS